MDLAEEAYQVGCWGPLSAELIIAEMDYVFNRNAAEPCD